MKVLKIAALLLVAILLVFTGWIYMAGMGVERTVLSTAYYHDLSSELNITDHLHEELQAQMTEQFSEEMPDELAGAIVQAFADAFHKQWFEEQFLLVADELLDWVTGRQDTLSAVIDLRDGKERLREALLHQVSEVADDLPDDMQMAPGETEVMVEEMLQEIDLPDELALAELVDEDTFPPHIESSLDRLPLFRGLFKFVPYILFALFLLISCLLAGFPGGLKWFGAGALLSGAAFFIVLQIGRATMLAPLITGPGIELPLTGEILMAVAGYTVSKFTTVPLIFAAAGLVLLVTGIVLGKVRRAGAGSA